MPWWYQSSPGLLPPDMASCRSGCSTGGLFSIDRPIAILRCLDLDTVKVWEVCRASRFVLCCWWYDRNVNLASLFSGKCFFFS